MSALSPKQHTEVISVKNEISVAEKRINIILEELDKKSEDLVELQRKLKSAEKQSEDSMATLQDFGKKLSHSVDEGDALKKKLTDLESTLEKISKEKEASEDQLEKLEATIGLIMKEKEELQSKTKTSDDKMFSLTTELRTKNAELSSLQEASTMNSKLATEIEFDIAQYKRELNEILNQTQALNRLLARGTGDEVIAQVGGRYNRRTQRGSKRRQTHKRQIKSLRRKY